MAAKKRTRAQIAAATRARKAAAAKRKLAAAKKKAAQKAAQAYAASHEDARVVTVPGSGPITVEVSGKDILVTRAKGITCAAGDVVTLLKQRSSWIIIAVKTAAPAGYITPDLVDETTLSGTFVVPPVETRSFMQGAWRLDTDDVFSGTYGALGNAVGCAWYGDALEGLSGSQIVSATIRVRRLAGGSAEAVAPVLRLLGENRRPTGGPGILGDAIQCPPLAPGQAADAITLPSEWVARLVAGTAGGVAAYTPTGTPYARLAGQSAWGQAFVISVKWRR